MSSWETENRLQKLENSVMQAMQAIMAMSERLDALEGQDNAVIEGDSVTPAPARNGKIKGKKTHG